MLGVRKKYNFLRMVGRWKKWHCPPDTRFWWCEGGGDRACWVVDKGFWACAGDLSPDMPCCPETRFSCSQHGSAIVGSDSPQSNKGNSTHPTWETKCQTLYCWLFKATTANIIDAGAAFALLLNGDTRVLFSKVKLTMVINGYDQSILIYW